ncbi:NAD(P)-dependent oxidoreductase [bacterium]|nr:NAD(P)-dependent oxidoreductase [Candidatus Omnitrophota bacterium]MBU3929161.1 NAD(P)-dependent oxidoreductase [bacterium]MBU4122437.1 NAD(P)-dependent oxidoreductase [bacterium]
MKRIFITGASGFIGRNVVKTLLQSSNKLMFLAKDKKEQKILSVYDQKIVTGNLKDIKRFGKIIKLFNPNTCIHLAWEGIPDYSKEISKRNLDNSIKLVDFISNETNCSKLIVSGSCWEYGKIKGICREGDAVNITSFFSWAKNSLHNYAKTACGERGIDLVWFRLFYVYGFGQRKGALIPELTASLKKGKCPDIRNPLNANDFIDVRDIARAFAIAVKKKIEPGIYNLGTGKTERVLDICRISEKYISGTDDFSKQLRRKSLRKKQEINFRADITKTVNALGWRPEIDIRKGIKNYLSELEAM